MSENEPESAVQRYLVRHYEKLGYIVVKVILCNKPGFPDLMLLKDGVASFVEVKRVGGKPRPLQEYRIKELRSAGFKVEVSDGRNINHS